SQTRQLTQELDHCPQPDMSQRVVTILPHGDCQNPEPGSHRKVLMLIRFFAPAGGLMMNAFGRRDVVDLPFATPAITEIQILTRRAAREERCKTSDRLERRTPDSARATANPLASERLARLRCKSIWQRRANQSSGFKSFDSAVQDSAIDAPEQRRRRHWLIDKRAH